jgi:hypothetical protein
MLAVRYAGSHCRSDPVKALVLFAEVVPDKIDQFQTDYLLAAAVSPIVADTGG